MRLLRLIRCPVAWLTFALMLIAGQAHADSPDVAVCDGKDAGDPCSVADAGPSQDVTGLCYPGLEDGSTQLVCQSAASDPCEGKIAGDPCSGPDVSGSCVVSCADGSGDGSVPPSCLVCETNQGDDAPGDSGVAGEQDAGDSSPVNPAVTACEGKSAGNPCTVASPEDGVCSPTSNIGDPGACGGDAADTCLVCVQNCHCDDSPADAGVEESPDARSDAADAEADSSVHGSPGQGGGGCSCSVHPHATPRVVAPWLLAGLAFLTRRRPRSSRERRGSGRTPVLRSAFPGLRES